MDIPITSAVDFIQSSFHTLASQAGQTNNRVAPIFPASFLRQGEIEHRVSHCSLRASSKHLAVAGAECNTVIELKPEHHAALPWHF
ncbi:hypothetical protein, partial [Pseudomonas asiatica]|uniref:hypothetical protein n=1 Tax=Pseudomonas asiatica TaxID=2219225 RepID=UPI001C45D800